MKYYVYALIDPENDQPFYIGKGQKNRMYQHLKGTNGVSKNKRIDEIRNRGQEPVPRKLYENLTEQEAWDKELELIQHYGRQDIEAHGILTNNCLHAKGIVMTDDVRNKISDQRQGIEFSTETKQKMSEARKGKTWEEIFGVEKAKQIREDRKQPRGPLSEETKAKIGKANSGAPRHGWSDEARKKLSETNKGKKPSQNTIDAARRNAKVVLQCQHCGKTGNGPAMRRWHMDNCKDKKC